MTSTATLVRFILLFLLRSLNPVNPIAIVTAVPLECAPIRRRLAKQGIWRSAQEICSGLAGPVVFPRGWLGGIPVVVACTRAGGRNALWGAEQLLSVWKPRAIIAAGLAAGLAPDIRRADLVVATAVRSGERTLRCWPGPEVEFARYGPLLHSEKVLIDPSEKRALAATGALAVDMESAAVAEVALAAGVPFAAVRAVSDAVDDPLPLDFNRCRTPNGDISPLRVVLRLARQPRALPGLLRFARRCHVATFSLAEFLAAWLPGWASSLPT
ncbi:MAG: hypothetical protein HY320_12585 [Armatimonadetes bacterium]|nr:hypothetical protein [Armatimonadota bacterium]